MPSSTPNPRRVAAGKLNSAKRRGLTPEGAEKLRQAALLHRPWEHSTGPRSVAGKLKSAANQTKQKGPVSIRAARREVAALEGLFLGLSEARKLLETNAGEEL